MSDKLKVSIFFFIGILVGLTGIVYADTTLVRGRGYNYGDTPPTHAYGDFDAIGSDGIIVEQTVGTIDDWELQFAVDMDYVNANITPSSSSVWVSDPISGDGTVGDPVTIGSDAIDDTHIDFGTGAGQVSSDDVPEGSVNLYNVDQNLWATIEGITANTTTDSLDFTGYGISITTGGDTITFTNDLSISSATTEVIFNNGGAYVGDNGLRFITGSDTLLMGGATAVATESIHTAQKIIADAGGFLAVVGNFKTDDGVIYLKEQASADGDVAGYGQLSIKNDTPNTLWFTNDAGTDYQCALPDQNLWETVTADTGNTTANSTTDNFSIVGGVGIATSIDSDTLTITNTEPDTNTDNEIISVGQSTAQGIVTLNLGIHCPMAVVKTGTANYAAVYISQWTPDLTADVITFTLYVNGGATDTWTTSAGAAGLSVSGASVSEAISQGDIVQIYGQVTTQNGSLDTIKAQSWSVNELITP